MKKLIKSKGDKTNKPRNKSPGTTIESRENELINMAISEAEKRIKNGTATSQILIHYLKLGSTTEKLQQAKLRDENALTRAKVDALKDQKKVEALYSEALAAMRAYSGQEPEKQ